MKKVYLSLVIVLASMFMANEASAQNYIAIDNQRGDDVRVTIEWFNCGGLIPPISYNVCANSIMTLNVPIADGLIWSYQTDQTTFVCTANCNYRIDGLPSPPNRMPGKIVCTDYSLTMVSTPLYSGTSGGVVVGMCDFHYWPAAGTYQGGFVFY